MKNRLFARGLIVMVFAVIALALGGCPDENDDINGGGWIVTDSGTKANFGFNFKCKGDEKDDYKIAKVIGQLQYNDHAGVRFHGVADSWLDGDTCNGWLDTWAGHYYGSYTPQPPKRDKKDRLGGRFEIRVVDKGKKGPSKGDELELWLTDGEYDTYHMKATLAGGNIQAHGDKVRE